MSCLNRDGVLAQVAQQNARKRQEEEMARKEERERWMKATEEQELIKKEKMLGLSQITELKSLKPF